MAWAAPTLLLSGSPAPTRRERCRAASASGPARAILRTASAASGLSCASCSWNGCRGDSSLQPMQTTLQHVSTHAQSLRSSFCRNCDVLLAIPDIAVSHTFYCSHERRQQWRNMHTKRRQKEYKEKTKGLQGEYSLGPGMRPGRAPRLQYNSGSNTMRVEQSSKKRSCLCVVPCSSMTSALPAL